MFKNVLLCYDGSAPGRRALKRGAELAILVGARVNVLSIVDGERTSPLLMAAATGHACLVDEGDDRQRSLNEAVERLQLRGVMAEGHLVHGNTIEQIAHYARRLHTDLIVIGHYPTAKGRWWSGADRASLAEHVNCCIFIAVTGESGAPKPASAAAISAI